VEIDKQWHCRFLTADDVDRLNEELAATATEGAGQPYAPQLRVRSCKL
jgi:hypothetical protein